MDIIQIYEVNCALITKWDTLYIGRSERKNWVLFHLIFCVKEAEKLIVNNTVRSETVFIMITNETRINYDKFFEDSF